MHAFLVYWLWPNPAGWHYDDSRVMALMIACAALVVASVIFRYVRHSFTNPMTRTLTAGWSTAALWLGIIGLVLAISRVETIQFVSMRLIWVIWALFLVLYIVLQFVQFRRRHYTVMAREQVVDEREKYLPRKKVR